MPRFRIRSRWVGLAAASVCVFATAYALATPPPVDLRNAHIGESTVTASIPRLGTSLKLTLDPELQRVSSAILARSGAHEGAIVVSDVRTGRVLAWASRGSRDFVSSSFAPPASLFKVVTATALLDRERATPDTRECYAGGEHSVTPRDLETHGSECTTLGEALGHSVNVVFAKLAKKKLSAPDLENTARELGFSGRVPIDVPVATSDADVPDDPFGLARAAAGFWSGKLSPLGALFAMQTIANDGERIRLSVLASSPERVSEGRAMSKTTAHALRRMLEVTTKRGTAAKAFHRPGGARYLPDVTVAAKTGTLVGSQPARMYSWFAGFAPSTQPEIAIAVMLGNDISWRTKANIVGREVLQSYFERPDAQARASSNAPGAERRR